MWSDNKERLSYLKERKKEKKSIRFFFKNDKKKEKTGKQHFKKEK